MSKLLKETKDVLVSFRCTKQEKEKLYKYAERNNMSVGDFVIATCILKHPQRDIGYICQLQTQLNLLKDGEIKKNEYIEKVNFLLGVMKWR